MVGVQVQGPVLLGMRKSFHVLQMGSSVREILDMVRLAVVDAQNRGLGEAEAMKGKGGGA
jgi:malate dehydrogenase (oxaloacetate-decarboxylating)(NADP+)